jgi:hypothetical protein
VPNVDFKDTRNEYKSASILRNYSRPALEFFQSYLTVGTSTTNFNSNYSASNQAYAYFTATRDCTINTLSFNLVDSIFPQNLTLTKQNHEFFISNVTVASTIGLIISVFSVSGTELVALFPSTSLFCGCTFDSVAYNNVESYSSADATIANNYHTRGFEVQLEDLFGVVPELSKGQKLGVYLQANYSGFDVFTIQAFGNYIKEYNNA